MCFANAIRATVAEEHPDLSLTERSKVIGEKWRALTPEEKKEYEDMSTASKEKYKQEMAEFEEKVKKEKAEKKENKKKEKAELKEMKARHLARREARVKAEEEGPFP